MKSIIYINLLFSLRRKMIGLVVGLFLLLALSRVIMLHNSPELVDAGLSDYLLLSIGGLPVGERLFKVLGWIGTIAPVTLFLYSLLDISRSYDTFLLTRMRSKKNWWIAKVSVVFIVSIGYGLSYFLINILVGSAFFPLNQEMVLVNQHPYYQPLAFLNIEWVALFSTMLISFLLGLFLFSMIILLLSLWFHNSLSYHVAVMIISVSSTIFYIQGILPKWLSPMMYPSLVDLVQTEARISTIFLFLLSEIGFAVVLILLGLCKIRKL